MDRKQWTGSFLQYFFLTHHFLHSAGKCHRTGRRLLSVRVSILPASPPKVMASESLSTVAAMAWIVPKRNISKTEEPRLQCFIILRRPTVSIPRLIAKAINCGKKIYRKNFFNDCR